MDEYSNSPLFSKFHDLVIQLVYAILKTLLRTYFTKPFIGSLFPVIPFVLKKWIR